MPKVMRKHGLQRPLSPHQLAGTATLVLLIALFYTTHPGPHLHSNVGKAILVLYSLVALIVWVSGFCTTLIDPSDPAVCARHHGSVRGEPPSPPLPPPPLPAGRMCYLCDCRVAARSKHCRRCNKCVSIFDHHCPWINTCVGERNYRWFIATLASIVALNLVQIGASVDVCVELADESKRERILASYTTPMPLGLYASLLGVSLLVSAVSAFLVSQLLFFHFGLMARRVTTYEWILEQRERDQEREGTASCCDNWVQSNAPCFSMCSLACDERKEKRAARRVERETKRPGIATRTANQGVPTERPRAASLSEEPSGPTLEMSSGASDAEQLQRRSSLPQAEIAAATVETLAG